MIIEQAIFRQVLSMHLEIVYHHSFLISLSRLTNRVSSHFFHFDQSLFPRNFREFLIKIFNKNRYSYIFKNYQVLKNDILFNCGIFRSFAQQAQSCGDFAIFSRHCLLMLRKKQNRCNSEPNLCRIQMCSNSIKCHFSKTSEFGPLSKKCSKIITF